MNPDKLFDYLAGNLSEWERQELEERLMSEPQLQRELDVARRIHAGMRSNRARSAEVLGDIPEHTAARGRRAMRQIMIAFGVLVFMNVILGLLYIAHHESSNPNRAALENQTRNQLQKALEKAAATSLTPPSIGVGEVVLTTEPGKVEKVAAEIVKLATRLQGTATKGVPDNASVEVLTEIPADRVTELRNVLPMISGVKSLRASDSLPANSTSKEKVSILIQLTEAK